MSFIEQDIEDAIKSALTTANAHVIDADNSAVYRRSFTGETSGAIDGLDKYMIAIDAEPNVPVEGFPKGPMRRVNVNISVKTHCTDDPTRASMAKLYDQIRAVCEYTTFTTTGVNHSSISGAIPFDVIENYWSLGFTMTFEVCVTYTAPVED
jgi:hypothetical protein